MIFPIRCITCNNVIAGKYKTYVKKVAAAHRPTSATAGLEYLTADTVKTVEGRVLDELGIKQMCCRRHFLAHVDLL
jgi:DNA-directed RNA polymerase subunit N (RpoN/RPB10)